MSAESVENTSEMNLASLNITSNAAERDNHHHHDIVHEQDRQRVQNIGEFGT